MGNVSIDFSLSNIWKCWYEFRKGKKPTQELEEFSFYLEGNLYGLYGDLQNGAYRHGAYRHFIVTDNKKRQISVASIRDRVVHRFLYNYLVGIYDKTFLFDVWSCRKNKGLLGAIERTQKFLFSHPRSFVWRADIKKFFDNVDHNVLFSTLSRKILDKKALEILKEVIASFGCERERDDAACRVGIPIGNLTSQIFANIYLNELDRYVVHEIKPRAYLRYGDDFFIIADGKNQLCNIRENVSRFLKEKLRLEINYKNDVIVKAGQGLHFLGCRIFPGGRRLNNRNLARIKNRVNINNLASYGGLMRAHGSYKKIKEFYWEILEKML